MEKNHLKKFRLVREYPGSPKLKTIVTKYQFTDFYTNNDNFETPENIVENNPEFWEKIIEKPFKILQCIAKKTRILKKETDMHIYQVERLSDNVIFTIGDVVLVNNKRAKITEIVNIENDIHLHMDDVRFINFNDATKLQKAFTTEDGVDMYVGDVYFLIDNTLSRNYQKATAFSHIGYTENRIRFAKEQNAITYLTLNKEHLSINDFISIIPKKYHKKLIDISRAKL